MVVQLEVVDNFPCYVTLSQFNGFVSSFDASTNVIHW